MKLKKRQQTSNLSSYVPSGLIAKTEKGYFYIKGNKRFKFISDKAMQTWNLKIVNTTEAYISNIKICGNLGFRDGTLIKDISSSKIYLISDSKKRHVVDPQVLVDLNYSKQDIIMVSQKEAGCHMEGERING
ncbi:MAG: hypothetical protein EB127_00850 [Alphaproteobacteria bacterium]|nr:hypothetical protein [Alphaproteobacteria bacterium]